MADKLVSRIVITYTFAGIHRWPNAPQDVAERYLIHPHRHLFHVAAKKRVTELDREIEFIGLRNRMLLYSERKFGGDPTAMSCEMMAADLLEHFHLCYCCVMEDGENGGEVEVA